MSDSGIQQPTTRLPGRWILLRDIGSWVAGWTMVFLEVTRPEVRDAVLIFAGSVLAIPGVGATASAVTEAIAQRRAGTGDSPSQPQEPAPSSSPQ